MKQRILLAILWSACLAAVTLLAGGALFIAVVVTFEAAHSWTDARYQVMVWIFRLVLFLSLPIGLILGWRGILPGTKYPKHSLARKSVPFVLVLTVIIIGGFFAWIALLSPPDRPNVSLTILKHTNDLSGGSVGVFAVSNLSSSAVLVWPSEIELPSSEDASAVPRRSHLPPSSVLRGRSAHVFAVSPAENPIHWRLVVLVYPDTIPVRFIKFSGVHILEALGLKSKYTVRSYGFYSDWIRNEASLGKTPDSRK